MKGLRLATCVAICAALLVSGCAGRSPAGAGAGATGGPNGFGLPIFTPPPGTVGFPLAPFTTTLVRSGECVVDDEGELLIWQPTFWLRGDALMDGNKQVGQMGKSIALFGGHYDAKDQPDLKAAMPPACNQPLLFYVSGIGTGS